jgi:hypothetical protein
MKSTLGETEQAQSLFAKIRSFRFAYSLALRAEPAAIAIILNRYDLPFVIAVVTFAVLLNQFVDSKLSSQPSFLRNVVTLLFSAIAMTLFLFGTGFLLVSKDLGSLAIMAASMLGFLLFVRAIAFCCAYFFNKQADA